MQQKHWKATETALYLLRKVYYQFAVWQQDGAAFDKLPRSDPAFLETLDPAADFSPTGGRFVITPPWPPVEGESYTEEDTQGVFFEMLPPEEYASQISLIARSHGVHLKWGPRITALLL